MGTATMSGVRTVWREPAFLAPGDRIAVVAPSGVVPRGELLAGLAWLMQRYRIVWSPTLFAREGYLAGTDAARGRALEHVLTDPAIKAVIAARGGYGAMRILEHATALRPPLGRLPWICGFSDVTAIHVRCQGLNVCSIHSPNVTGLGRAHAEDRARLIACLEDPSALAPWRGLEVLARGRRPEVEGTAVGGNLALVHAMAASGEPAPVRGAVVFLEDVTEKPYRVDRMLTSLLHGGFFREVGAVVLGTFEQCAPGPDGVRVRDVAQERLRGLQIPVLAGAPFGHGVRNAAFVLGRSVRVTERVLESAAVVGEVSFGAEATVSAFSET